MIEVTWIEIKIWKIINFLLSKLVVSQKSFFGARYLIDQGYASKQQDN